VVVLWRKPKQWMYTPLTERDYAVHRDPRYRVGHWLRSWYDQLTAIAACVAFGLPVAVVVDGLRDDLGGEMPRAYATGVVMWVISVALLYSRWFEHRQAVSERRRGYRFYVLDNERDIEIAEAKQALLSMTATDHERQEALDLLLNRGACSLPGQPAPQSSLD
jgi:hypothetical protein